MNFDEKWDIYDENKVKTGRTKFRFKEELVDGEYIIGIQAIIINSDKKILISQRAKDKYIAPLLWECNGGALLAGEESYDGIIREIREELGIDLSNDKGILYKSRKGKHGFKDIYLFKKDYPIEKISFKDGEAQAAKWVSIDEFESMHDNGEIVKNPDFDRNDYNKCIEILGL